MTSHASTDHDAPSSNGASDHPADDHGAHDAAGHDSHGSDHHAGHDNDEPADTAVPSHVVTIAVVTSRIGISLFGLGAAAAIPLGWWYGLIGVAVGGFVSLYGCCVWLAARDQLAAAR